MPDCRFEDVPPQAEEYLMLRKLCELGPRSLDGARAGLPNSLYATCGRDGNNALIALGRIVGDGGCFVQVSDVAVHPDWQGRGLGQAVMVRLMGWCRANLPDQCYVSLVSNTGLPAWYERFGFTICPADKPGMAMTILADHK